MEGDSKSPMVLILPPDNPRNRQERALSIIRRIDKVLSSPHVWSYLDQCIQDGYLSVQKIQEGHYELFVMNAAGKGSLCFDKLLKQENFSSDDKNVLVVFAKQQAHKDTRLSCSDAYKFTNFSIIITYDKVNKQRPHIDLLEPNYQFGCFFRTCLQQHLSILWTKTFVLSKMLNNCGINGILMMTMPS